VKTVLQLARTCDTIFDIGANVGLYSVVLGQRFPDARIVAFEPIPSTLKEFERNLELNAIHNVTVHRIGLSDHAANATFYFDATATGATSGAPLGPEFGATETLTCPVETLDQFVTRTGDVPQFIKCDVEGGELSVFRGGAQTLKTHTPMIFTEMLRKWSLRFGYHPNEIITFLGSFGYECFSMADGLLKPFATMTEETVETNFFFLHAVRHKPLAEFLGLFG
jgi:FkbM family methyltransferase